MIRLLDRTVVLVALAFATMSTLAGQRFYPDDPIRRDLDNRSIQMPVRIDLSPTFDLLENTFGSEAGPLARAENVNTLGEVPDSSWFTNRLGTRDLSVREFVDGTEEFPELDASQRLTIVGAGLGSIIEGLAVEDPQGQRYYLVFDRAGLPNLATGASMITTRFYHAIGYNVAWTSLAEVDPTQFEISPDAQILQLEGKGAPVDREYVELFLDSKEKGPDGLYRVVAHLIPDGVSLGEFKFYGTRPDDPNDIFAHENRRELRGLRLFSAWLNADRANAISTRDFYVTEGGRSFVRHFLVDFTSSLGAGWNLDDEVVSKDKLAGFEYWLLGDGKATFKTAASFGIWERPWAKLEYPDFPEIGTIEADLFNPELWKPSYPNPAFDRMLPDDEFWAAQILSRVSDDAIRAVVASAEYEDSAAAEYLAGVLIKRRDKLVQHAFRRINPLVGFRLEDGDLVFENLGVAWSLATDPYYEYEWLAFNNRTGQSTPITGSSLSQTNRIALPRTSADYLMARLRTRTPQQREWKKNVIAYIRQGETPAVVGIDREIGVFTLERAVEGGQALRQVEFGGTYRGLDDSQKILVDDWVTRLNRVLNRRLPPDEVYDNLPFSTRTTFEAVTNALGESLLTGEDGSQLGSALGLVRRVDNVRGFQRDTRGDQQFRMYVTLVPEATKTLDSSREFQREADNTVYHKGYPLNYRQQGGTPSIQISTSSDGARADIDVDYRSSSFPKALFNGHLTASNSDVRAGNNYSQHVGRWEGFTNWWRGLFGLPAIESFLERLDPGETLIPLKLDKAGGKLAEAVEDFLSSWLVREQAEIAAAYFGPTSFACTDMWPDPQDIDYGVAPYLMLDRLAKSAAALGKIERLPMVVSPVAMDAAGWRLDQETPLFKIYSVPENEAVQMLCGRSGELEFDREKVPSDYGKYFISSFQLSDKGSVAIIWNRIDNQWRIASYQLDVEAWATERAAALAAEPEPEPEPVILPEVSPDPGFLSASQRFMANWRQGDVDTASSYFSPESLACVRRYLEEEVATDNEALARLKLGMRRVYEALSNVPRPEDAVRPVEFFHPRVVTFGHDRQEFYTLAAVPGFIGEQYGCAAPSPPTSAESPDLTYGNYFVLAIQFDLADVDPIPLYLLWSRFEEEWRIVAFHLPQP